MAIKWFKIQNIKGLRYYEHASRIYKKRKDRNFVLQYRFDGKVKNETLGWESDGWNIEKAVAKLQELKQNQKTGEGAKTLAEKRELVKESEKLKIAQNQQKQIDYMTFSDIYDKYIEHQKTKTGKKTWESEMYLYKNWVQKEIGHMKLTEIKIDHLQPLITNILNAGRKPATAKYLKAFIRQVFNYAISRELFFGNNPAIKISTPDFDNRRQRFFSIEEITLLLTALKSKSKQWHDIAVFAMYTGCRPIEIFSLTWESVDFKNEIITIFDTKNKNSTRHVPITLELKALLEEIKTLDSCGLVFKSTKGDKITKISNTFARTIKELGINNNAQDDRQKGVFYTLRHSYASWLVAEGTDIYTVKELLGHSNISMTERYSHLSPEHLKKAVKVLDKYKIETA